MHIKFVPTARKDNIERAHYDDRHPSMNGPTFDSTGESLRPFDQAN